MIITLPRYLTTLLLSGVSTGTAVSDGVTTTWCVSVELDI